MLDDDPDEGSPRPNGTFTGGWQGGRAKCTGAGQITDQLLQAGQLAAQVRPRAQDRFGRGFQHRVASDQFPDTGLVA